MNWSNVAEELDKLSIAMNRIRVAYESITHTYQELIDFVKEHYDR